MPTTQITETAFQTALAEAADAAIAHSWATARDKLMQAELINTGLLTRLTVGSVDKTRRESLDRAWKMLADAETRSGVATDNRRLCRTQMGYGS